MLLIAIFLGQAAFGFLRTSSVAAIANGSRVRAVTTNGAASLLRLAVMTGGVTAILSSNWVAVVAFVAGGAVGDWISMSRQTAQRAAGLEGSV